MPDSGYRDFADLPYASLTTASVIAYPVRHQKSLYSERC